MYESALLVLLFTLSLLVCSAFAIGASAAEGNPEFKIYSYNISYEGDFKFMVAVPKNLVSDNLTIIVKDKVGNELNTTTISKTELEGDAFADPTFTVNGVSVPMLAIRSDFQISAKDIATEYQLVVKSGENTSEAVTYSLALYLNERLYKNGIILAQNGSLDADRRDLYLATLGYGAKAQEVLGGVDANKTADKLIYSNVTGEYKLYEPGATTEKPLIKNGNMVTFEKNEDGSYSAIYTIGAFTTAGEKYTFADDSPTVVILTSKAPATEGGEE